MSRDELIRGTDVLREQLAYEQRAHLAHDDQLADLRAQIEALRDEAMDHHRDTGEPVFAASIVAYQTVLALLGGDDA